MQDELLEPEEAAQCLRTSVKNVHRLVRDGKLSCVQYSRKKRFFKKSHLDEFIEDHTVAKAKSVDKKHLERLPSLKKGGAKSVEGSGTDLAKEIRSLWQ